MRVCGEKVNRVQAHMYGNRIPISLLSHLLIALSLRAAMVILGIVPPPGIL